MEAARQAQEKALEECTRLRQQLEQSGAGGGNADDVAKKYEDALVKLGTAELRASKAQQDLKSQEGAQQALGLVVLEHCRLCSVRSYRGQVDTH